MTDQDPIQPATPPPAPSTPPPAPSPAATPPGYMNDSTTETRPWAIHENGVAPPAATESVAAVRPGSSRLRWGIALGVVAVLAVAVAAAAVLLTGSHPTASTALAWAPKGSVVYAEARLDLPGDQQQKLGSFLSHFPGFADQSTLPAKLDEALDRIVKSATKDKQDYTTNIKPWFGGQVGLAMPTLPTSMPQPSAASPSGAGSRGLALVSVSDAAKAQAWFDGLIADQPHTADTYNGVALVIGQGNDGAEAIVDGKLMLVGDVASVKAAIDTKGTAGLGTSDRYTAAQAALTGDDVASFYLDGTAYADWIKTLAASNPATSSAADAATLARLPDWVVGQVRVENDALVLDTATPHSDAGPKRDNRVSKVSGHLPASTIAVLDPHDVGAAALDAIATARKNPSLADAFKQADAVVGILGGFDGVLGWIGDTDIVVTRDGTTVGGGVVISPTDRAAADKLLTSVKSFILLGGGQSGVTMHDEPYAGATITVVDLGGLVGSQLPAGSTALPAGATQLAYTVTDDVVAFGVGDTFVKAVLDAKPGSSLADAPRYKALMDRAGAQNVASAYVDVTAVRELVESMAASSKSLGSYDADTKPYLAPFDALAFSSTVGSPYDRTKILLTVK